MLRAKESWQQDSLGDYLAQKIYDKGLTINQQSKIVQDVCLFDSVGRLLHNGYFQPIFVNLSKKIRMLFIQEAMKYDYNIMTLLLNSRKYKFNDREYSVVVKRALQSPQILSYIRTTILDLPDKYMKMLYPNQDDVLRIRDMSYYYQEEEE